ncbi:glycosyltransferase family 2 protein [Microbacterium sp. YMB-B2]|uniref:Glycosyltransferase family 2 protein n=1 Tax=Microbacterium tenebrionis TaxID=2830665 RepID=A0A9X1LPS8_9MICO|nr:glycosyltransferase family 2 protein [Microbacterium tenebrionis]MCC2029635.1 glycosyltransferase family 2 protein [Microbacterium tenebrionis]
MTLLAHDDTSSRVAAIIVTYNSAPTLPGLLASLDAATAPVRAIIVDNGSADETLTVAAREPRALTIATGANLGYSGGINVGRRYVRDGEHIAILNPDLTVEPGALERLLQAIDADPAVGIAVPQLRGLDHDGRFDSLRREPSVTRALGDSIFGNRWRERPSWLAETLRADRDYGRSHDVAWAGGAALLISAGCDRRVGEWDSATYFLYSEETDYARRARDAGYSVRYVPEAIARHEGSGSGQPAPLVALISVNRIRYFERLHGPTRTALFRGAVAVQHLLRPHDPRHRHSLPIVLNRARWRTLPAGDPEPATLSVHSASASIHGES